MFPSKSRKFVHLEAEQAYDSILYLMKENLGARNIETQKVKNLAAKAKIGGASGVMVKVQVFPEGAVSALEFGFSYMNFQLSFLILLVAVIGLSLAWQTAVPMVGLVLILPMGYRTNSITRQFMNTINEALPHLEREFARRALVEDRKRWKLEPKDTDDLYRRLREKHMKTWGNTNILEYKITEYKAQSLTRDEAIRKTAEEEGIY